MAKNFRFMTPVNAQLRQWQELKQAKGRRQHGLFLAEGLKVVSELLKSGREVESLLVLDSKKERWGDYLRECGHIVYELKDPQWRKLSQDKSSEGIMALARKPAAKSVQAALADGHDRILMLFEVNNPNNLGALLRTAQWFGFGAVLLGKGSVEITNPKVVRTSMGSIFHLDIVEDVDFDQVMSAVKNKYFTVAGHAKKGLLPHHCKGRTGLMLGSESHGLPDSLIGDMDELWQIPGGSGADSLSLPQAAAILMYECAGKR